jgi:hypothetical protein
VQWHVTVNQIEVAIDLPGVSKTALKAIGELLDKSLARPSVKNRDAIKDAFLTALKTCPTANPSDLWHHIVYRQYLEILNRHQPQKPDQSWKRASGDALELAVEELYSALLLEHNIRIEMLIGKPRKLVDSVSNRLWHRSDTAIYCIASPVGLQAVRWVKWTSGKSHSLPNSA